jgi:uncharacterized protein YodC (DUF2158 family)
MNDMLHEKTAPTKAVYFNPGDTVRLKNIPNSPHMLVMSTEKDVASGRLKGIRVQWFAEGGKKEEETYNTKDLVHVFQRAFLG